jgi:hypothetical protein
MWLVPLFSTSCWTLETFLTRSFARPFSCLKTWRTSLETFLFLSRFQNFGIPFLSHVLLLLLVYDTWGFGDGGQGQAMREQAVLREEMQYHYRLGNFEVPTSHLSYFSEAATYIALLCVLGSDLLLEMPLVCNWPVMNHKAGHSGLVPGKE